MSSNFLKKRIFYIEGNVGVGKSTLLKRLKESGILEKSFPNLKIGYLTEPVEDWINYKDKNGNNILDLFYKNQDRLGFSFQWHVFMSRTQLIMESLEEGCDLLIVERSIYTDKNVFMKSLYTTGKVSNIEYKMYNDWFNWILGLSNIPKANFIYFQLNTDECYKRIMKRNREEEKSIDKEYLDSLNKNHDNWLLKMEQNRICIIDGTIEKEDNSVLEKIKKFIEDGTV